MSTEKLKNIELIAPLSPMQFGMLYQMMKTPFNDAYMGQASMEIVGELDENDFRKTFDELVKRQPILRTRILHHNLKKPVQVVKKEGRADFSVYKAASEDEFDELCMQEMEKKFDFAKDCLSRFTLIKMSDGRNRFVWTFHHIILDAVSVGILSKEIMQIYSSIHESQEISLKKALPFSKYVDWLNEQDIEKDKKFWGKYLEGYDEISKITDYSADTSQLEQKGKLEFDFNHKIYEKLCNFCRENEVTLNVAFLSIWGLLLARYTNKKDVVFGSVVSTRPNEIENVEDIAGPFINTIPVRYREESLSFKELVKEKQKEAIESFEFWSTPLSEIQKTVGMNTDLFNHIVAFENYRYDMEAEALTDSIGIKNFKLLESVGYAFAVQVLPQDTLKLCFLYDRKYFTDDFVKNVKRHLEILAADALEKKEEPVSTLSLLTTYERKNIVKIQSKEMHFEQLDMSISQILDEQAKIRPKHVAIYDDVYHINYAELQRILNYNANVLIRKGVTVGSIVAVLGRTSIRTVVACLSILRTGAAYLPIDTDTPKERIDEIFTSTSECKAIIVCDETDVPNLLIKNVISLAYEKSEIVGTEEWDYIDSPQDIAYVMCTSGSSGRPKSVLIRQQGIIRLAIGQEIFSPNSNDVILHESTPSFDASTLEIYFALLNGASLRVIKKSDLLDSKTLKHIIQSEKITAAFFSTSLLGKLYLSDGQVFEGLHYIITGGDALSNAVGTKIAIENRGAKVINFYGPTENTVVSTGYVITGMEKGAIPIGKCINNSSGFVFDCFGNLQADGLPGEFVVGGIGVSPGYLGNEKLTQEKFIKMNEIPDFPLYKTGDCVFKGADENYYFLGRIDNQVKIRGYRVELEEVKQKMLEIDGVDMAEVVTAKEGEFKRLCAFYISENGVPEDRVSLELSEKLPDYMLPEIIKRLEEMPRKLSGKIDSYVLKEFASTYKIEYVEADTETEQRLVNLWKNVLQRERVGIDENFFLLGGDSIKAMQLVSLGEKEGLYFSLPELYQSQNIRNLAVILDGNDGTGFRRLRSLPAELKNVRPNVAERYEIFHCNDIQEAYVMGRNSEFELGGFSTHYYTELEGNVEIDRLEKALNKIIQKHPVLRTVLVGKREQRILRNTPEYKINYEDLSSLEKKEREEKLVDIRKSGENQSFNLEKWPLFQMEAYKIAKDKIRICFGIDILVVDAASLMMVEKELAYYYENPSEVVKESEFSFRDYCIAMEKFKKSQNYERDREYWHNRLETFPLAPKIEVDTRCVIGKIPKFNRKAFSVEENKWEKIKSLCSLHHVTPAALLCTLYGLVLSDWSGQEHFALDLTVFDRYPFNEEVSRLIGDFTKIMLVEMNLSRKAGLWENVKKTNKELSETLEHSDYTGLDFMRAISSRYELGTSASMPFIFTCALYTQEYKIKKPILEETYARSRTPQVYLDNQVTVKNRTLSIVWDYPEEIWKDWQIDAMFSQYCELISNIGNEGEGKLKTSSTITALYKKYNSTWDKEDELKKIKETTLNHLILPIIKQKKKSVAVVVQDRKLTYEMLDILSDKVAWEITDRKIGEGETIAIEGHRTVETLAAIVGVLKAGCAYVPINMEYPEERREYIITQSKCRFVIDKKIMRNIEMKEVNEFIPKQVSPDSTAYVIFTSGSTGKPKGVVITHSAAANTIKDINERFHVTEKDCIIGLSSFGFDLSVYDVFGSFSTGAKLALVHDQRNVVEIEQVLEKEKVTFWNSVPAVMEMYLTAKATYKNVTLKHILLSGDWISLKLPARIRECFKKADITSLGGATEASIWSIYYPIPSTLDKNWISIPYGMPLRNQQIYVLDENDNLCPPGVRGEICIGGIGVAKGYINEPEKTEAVFVEHEQYGRIYHTGDTGIFREEYVEFTGRLDNQVKIRGFRIEIGEIEAKALEEPMIKEAVVTVWEDDNEDTFLAMYFVEQKEGGVDVKRLKERLQKSLPAYMIPSAFVKMKKLPLSSNGKIDRKALPRVEMEVDTRYMQPENEKEDIILKLWQQVLQKENIGVRQNFFEIGGNSMKAIQFTTLAEQAGLKILLPDMFRLNTVEQLAKVAMFSNNVDKRNAERLREWVIMMENYKDSAKFSREYSNYLEKYKKPVYQKREEYEHYFITGGAGFFAAHLIADILMTSKAKITTLIRSADDGKSAEEKLQCALKFYIPERNLYEEYKDRINVIEGDVSDEHMGLSEKIRTKLKEEVDCVIHAATMVKHYGLWSAFEKVNIQGTRNVTELLESGRDKQFVFISTLSAGYTLGRNNLDCPYTEDCLSNDEKSDNYYIQSKLRAEEIVEKLAEQGYKIKIFRLGFLVQSYKRGIFQMNSEENALFQMLETTIRIGHVPDMTSKMFDMSYVDYAAKAVHALVTLEEKGHIYHIFNPDRMSLGRFAEYCVKNGVNIQIMKQEQFFEYVFDNLESLSNDMSHLLTLTMADGGIRQTLAFQYKCDKTNAILKDLGIEWPKVSSNQIQDILKILGKNA